MKKISRVQRTAARLVLLSKEQYNTLPLLKQLHWLPLSYRIKYKVLVLTFKALKGYGPSYLSELLQSVRHEHKSLRSNFKHLLALPLNKSVTYGDRCFSVFAPSLWNSIPQHLCALDSLLTFKKMLKTHFCTLAYKST